jgi:hypothetical protein
MCVCVCVCVCVHDRIIAYMQKISTREWLAAEMGTPLNSTHYGLCA